MSASVKIESHHGSTVISHQTLEGAAGVKDAGGNVVLPGGNRLASRTVDDSRRTSREDEEGQWSVGAKIQN